MKRFNNRSCVIIIVVFFAFAVSACKFLNPHVLDQDTRKLCRLTFFHCPTLIISLSTSNLCNIASKFLGVTSTYLSELVGSTNSIICNRPIGRAYPITLFIPHLDLIRHDYLYFSCNFCRISHTQPFTISLDKFAFVLLFI